MPKSPKLTNIVIIIKVDINYKVWYTEFVSLYWGCCIKEVGLYWGPLNICTYSPIIKYMAILKEMLNIAQLFGRVLWDLVAGESICPLILILPIYEEALMLCNVEFPTSN
jgi:hypothetical protein